jgi:hypothetical protein
MNTMGELKRHHASLKQVGKQLKVMARFDDAKDPAMQIAQAGALLDFLDKAPK